MKLSESDLVYISQRMETYPIIYQEIYDEILDHVISAVETARANDDHRDIELVFNEIMDTHFGGVKEIRGIVLQNVMAYNKKIGKQFRANIKGYLTLQVIVLIAIIIIGSFYLPETKTINSVLLFAVIIASFFSIFYTLIKTWSVKKTKRKMSLTVSHVRSLSQYLTFITYAILFVPRFMPKSWLPVFNPLRYSPFIYVTLLCFFVIYTLSVVQLYKQLFKTDTQLPG